MLLQSAQMGNNLAEQQVKNSNKVKTKQQTQEQLSSPLSQVLRTYDFGNFENCELNTEIILIYHWLHSLCTMCRIYTKEPPFSCRIMLVHSDPDPSTCERDLPLQMGTHWQCGGLLYPPNSLV